MTRTALLEKIAKDFLHIETLQTRNSDSLDFHDIGVGCLSDALNAAFEAGIQHQKQEQRIKEAAATVTNVVWQTIAKSFPEIKTGDYPPDMAEELERMLYHHTKLWVQYNQPAE